MEDSVIFEVVAEYYNAPKKAGCKGFLQLGYLDRDDNSIDRTYHKPIPVSGKREARGIAKSASATCWNF